MLTRLQHRVLTAIAAATLMLVLVDAWMVMGNRQLQAAFSSRQVFLQQTAQLDTLYREIARSLADLALKSNDQQVLQMLGDNGINVTPNPVPAPAPLPAAPAAPGKR
jgi:hypothetical protein